MLFAPSNVIIAKKLTKFIQIEQLVRNPFRYEKSGMRFFQNFWRFGISGRKAFCANFMHFLDILTIQGAKHIYIYQTFQRAYQ